MKWLKFLIYQQSFLSGKQETVKGSLAFNFDIFLERQLQII